MVAMAVVLAACSGGAPTQPSGEGGHYKALRPYQINGRWYEPYYDPTYHAVGIASWYGDPFHGRLTANGERYDKRRLSAAHKTLPLPSIVRVTNLANGRSIEVRVNDRGPFVGERVIDLSEAAAEVLGFKHQGLAEVEIRFLGLADARGTPPEPTVRRAEAPAASPPAPVAAAPATVVCEGYYVQVGAFVGGDGARAAAQMLEARFPASVSGQVVRDGDVARVRVGPFVGVDAAHRALATVSREGYGEAFIMKLNAPAGRCPARTV